MELLCGQLNSMREELEEIRVLTTVPGESTAITPMDIDNPHVGGPLSPVNSEEMRAQHPGLGYNPGCNNNIFIGHNLGRGGNMFMGEDQ
jgi:hypothetical protein